MEDCTPAVALLLDAQTCSIHHLPVSWMVPRVQLGSACAEPTPRTSLRIAPSATAPSSSARPAQSWALQGGSGWHRVPVPVAQSCDTVLPALPWHRAVSSLGVPTHPARNVGTAGWGGWPVPWAHSGAGAGVRGSDGTSVPPVCPPLQACRRMHTLHAHTHTPCSPPRGGQAEQRENDTRFKGKERKIHGEHEASGELPCP